jgi:hypothetical protein
VGAAVNNTLGTRLRRESDDGGRALSYAISIGAGAAIGALTSGWQTVYKALFAVSEGFARYQPNVLTAVDAEADGVVGAAVEPRPLDLEADCEGFACEDTVVKKVHGARHLAELFVHRPVAQFGNPAWPAVACRHTPLKLRDVRRERCLVRRGGVYEELAPRTQPFRDPAHASLHLIAGEEVEHVRAVHRAERAVAEPDVSGEAGKERAHAVDCGRAEFRIGINSAAQFGEVLLFEIVGDDPCSGFQGGDGGESEGSADIERGGIFV